MTPKAQPVDSLMVVGAVHVDDIAQPLEPLVSRASNPVVWTQKVGGVAANAASAAQRVKVQGLSVVFLAAVGDDTVAEQLNSALLKCDLDTRLVRLTENATGRYSAVMDFDGELYIGLADVSLAEKLTADDVLARCDLGPNTALLLDANLSENCLTALSAQATTCNSYQAAMSVSPVKTRRLLPLAQQIDLLFCNRREALAMNPQLRDSVSLDTLADNLLTLGFTQFVLTDGAAPLIAQDSQQRHVISVPEVSVAHNVNGAGDALAGATFAAWVAGMGLNEAILNHGLPEASRVVTGEQASILVGCSTQC